MVRLTEAMSPDPPIFDVAWPALPDGTRRFLLAASDLDDQFPHHAEGCQVIPTLKWRTVGAMCGMTADESDRLVGALSDAGWVTVHDPAGHRLLLHHRWELRQLRARRREARMALVWGGLGGVAFVLYSWARGH